MRKLIARIKLAPGQAGFFDELSNLHVTISNRFANVYADMNTTYLKKAAKSGRIYVIEGSLDKEITAEPVVSIKKEIEPIKEVEIKEVPVEPVQEVVEAAVEEVAVEIEEEVVVEEVVEEAKQKSVSKKKKSTKKEDK